MSCKDSHFFHIIKKIVDFFQKIGGTSAIEQAHGTRLALFLSKIAIMPSIKTVNAVMVVVVTAVRAVAVMGTVIGFAGPATIFSSLMTAPGTLGAVISELKVGLCDEKCRQGIGPLGSRPVRSGSAVVPEYAPWDSYGWSGLGPGYR